MKTLKYVTGNLLLSKDVDVIGHQCNCQNTMGSGIARSIKEMYPEAWQADVEANLLGENTLGNLSVADIAPETSKKHGTKIKFIFNLYGQNLYGKGNRQTDYEAIYSALEGMAASLAFPGTEPRPVVGFPYLMSSFRAGGNWDIISRMIEVAFDTFPGDVLIYKLDNPTP
jgi:O-acetyl-ADP-ribose deacetylase (regulator of RNase III)